MSEFPLRAEVDGKAIAKIRFLRTMTLDPLVNLGKPFAAFSNKVLLRQINDVNLRFSCDHSPVLDDFDLRIFELSCLDRSV